MKLIGSNIEQEFKMQLLSSRKSLFEDVEKKRLLSIIYEVNPHAKTAYVLEWIPDQEEDFYKILVNDDLILSVELNRNDSTIVPIVNQFFLKEYQKGLNKIGQIKLMVALELAEKEL